ncbi:MAG: hypothetical protein ACM3QW_06355 [Ignavibacteriales bacterium]
MPSLKPRLTFVADKLLVRQIDKFWHQNEFRSRSEAIVWMLEYVLREKPTVPPKEERPYIFYEK